MKDDRLYLIHISESIAKIDTYISGLDTAAFLQRDMVQDAVLRNLQVLAESTQRLSDTLKERHPEIEWYKISGLRNVLVHDYLGIDLNTVWLAVRNNLPELKTVIQNELGCPGL